MNLKENNIILIERLENYTNLSKDELIAEFKLLDKFQNKVNFIDRQSIKLTKIAISLEFIERFI